jgi:hypothetical protein
LDQAVAAQRVRADGEEGVQVLTRGQGSTRGFRSTPAVTATTHSTLITAGTIGRTVSGSTASKRTSDTAATTKRRDRRAHWWTRQNSARAA